MKTKPNPINLMNKAEQFIIIWIQGADRIDISELEDACRAHLNLEHGKKLPPEYDHAIDLVNKEWSKMVRRNMMRRWCRETRAPEIIARHKGRKANNQAA